MHLKVILKEFGVFFNKERKTENILMNSLNKDNIIIIIIVGI